VKIEVHHVTRVEGHGSIVVDLAKGEIKECRFDVVEAPRFFEAMLRGRPHTELSHITSRICGICSVGHGTASVQATEKAMGVEISEQAWLLRKLIMHGEIIDSHVLHTYYLAAPDQFGVDSVIPLVKTHREVVERALRIKKLSGDLCAMIAGRHIHPCALVVGGFTHTPTAAELESMAARLVDARADMDATVDLFAGLKWPEFERETEYVSLRNDDEYAFIGDTIVTSDGFTYPVEEYQSVTNEECKPTSTAKFTHHNRASYMVGAMARLNINFDQLHPRAKDAAAKLGLEPMLTNPYLNTPSQVVEMVHCVEDAIRITEELLARPVQLEGPADVDVKAGQGVCACEVPRGTLFHRYVYDEDGLCQEADCVIPTNQNLGSINEDMQELVPQIKDKPQEEIRLLLEMLVRAYDPCISCSTHFLTVEFV